MVVIVVAVGIGEMGALHTQLRRLLVHQRHKFLGGAGHRLGQDVAGLIGGGDQIAVQQLFHGEDLSGLDAGGGAAGGDPYCLCRGGDGGVRRQIAPVDGFQHQQGGHDLGDGGGVHFLVGVVVVEHFTVVAVHHDGGAAAGHGILQGGGREGGQGYHQNNCQKQRKKTIFFHRILPISML